MMMMTTRRRRRRMMMMMMMMTMTTTRRRRSRRMMMMMTTTTTRRRRRRRRMMMMMMMVMMMMILMMMMMMMMMMLMTIYRLPNSKRIYLFFSSKRPVWAQIGSLQLPEGSVSASLWLVWERFREVPGWFWKFPRGLWVGRRSFLEVSCQRKVRVTIYNRFLAL